MGRLKLEPAKTPKQRHTEEKEDHEQEHVHINGHNDPRCLKWGEGRAPYIRKDKESLPCCQASGRVVRIIHHRESLYHHWVLPLDMVENSTSPCEHSSGWFSSHTHELRNEVEKGSGGVKK